MKKVFLVLSVLILACSLFATETKNYSFRAGIMPLGLQSSVSSDKNSETTVSDYGIGFDAKFIFHLNHLSNGPFAEFGINGNAFTLKDKEPKEFSNILISAGLGYTTPLYKEFSVFGHINAGMDTLMYNGSSSDSFTLVTGAGLMYVVNDLWNVHAAVDASFGFTKSSTATYTNIRILPMLGITLNF